jgi:beta-lactamase class A
MLESQSTSETAVIAQDRTAAKPAHAHDGRAHDRHDHTACIATAMATAAAMCAERGEKLTPLRRRVLELIWGSRYRR